jgi:hypothetical protein
VSLRQTGQTRRLPPLKTAAKSGHLKVDRHSETARGPR